MSPDTSKVDSFPGVDLQDLSNQITCIVTELGRIFVVALSDLFKKWRQPLVTRSINIKGQSSREHREENNPQTPYIYQLSTVLETLDQLWGGVMWTSASRPESVIWSLLQCSHTKICNLDISVLSQKYVFGLEVSMADLKRMAVSNRAEYLPEIFYGFFFPEPDRPGNMGKQLSVVSILEY